MDDRKTLMNYIGPGSWLALACVLLLAATLLCAFYTPPAVEFVPVYPPPVPSDSPAFTDSETENELCFLPTIAVSDAICQSADGKLYYAVEDEDHYFHIAGMSGETYAVMSAQRALWNNPDSPVETIRLTGRRLAIPAEVKRDFLQGFSMDGESFSQLFTLMLSRYDVGTIPVSLDRVSAGDFDRNRRRHVKHLIVLGASDERLPRAEEGGGVFSPDERQRLLELDIDLGAGGDNELWREFSLIYHTLSLPSESLTLLCPLADADGAAVRPASVFRRAQALFRLPVRTTDLTDARMSAPAPALSLAAEAIRGAGGREQAAWEYFAETDPARTAALEQAAHAVRGSLSRAAVERLYGSSLRLSPSRIEKFASCRFAYFCQYGLRARPYEPAGFQPPEMGVFLHYILENTAREVHARGGFRRVTDEELTGIADTYIERYIHDELNDFQEKSRRFLYLFRRLRDHVRRVVLDMAAELRRSDFEPLDFELDFSKASDIPPVELGELGGSLSLTGIADRVDGWLHGGKLYLRVVDYKTGRKEFSLSDVWYGRILQMLLYLFTLADGGGSRYGSEIVPAGVVYIPARSPMLSAAGPTDDAELDAARAKELRRSGLVLDDPSVMEAWEHGEDKRYIPVKFKNGAPSSEAVADL